MASKKDQKKVKIIDSWKKKRWYPIVAPKIFGSAVLGETPILEAEFLKGRCVIANLGILMRDSKKQNVNMTFEVMGIAEGKAITQMKRIVIIPSSIKRLVRRGQERIDDSFLVTTKDGLSVRLKPFFLTKNQCSNLICTSLRMKARELFEAYAKETTFDNLVQDILSKKMIREAKAVLDKIFPLKVCELRVVERVLDNSVVQKQEGVVPVKPTLVEEAEEEVVSEAAFEEVAEE